MGDKKSRGTSFGGACGTKWQAFVGSFFQKRESHKITHRSGHHKTELDLVLIKKEQLWKIKDCKAIPREHTKHKPVVFVVRMKRTKLIKIIGRKTIKWWKCIDGVAIEYRDRVKVKYEELWEEVDDVDEEWNKYKDAFVGNAEKLCGRSTGMGGTMEKQERIRNGGQPKSHQQYVKRRKPGRLLKI